MHWAVKLNMDQIVEFLMSCTRKGKDTEPKKKKNEEDWLLTDPAEIHVLSGLNCLQLAVMNHNHQIALILLETVKSGRVLHYNQRLKGYSPLKLLDFVC